MLKTSFLDKKILFNGSFECMRVQVIAKLSLIGRPVDGDDSHVFFREEGSGVRLRRRNKFIS
jgi:hypothetical protein